MELKGVRQIPASIESTWHALNDPEILKSCIAGCESLERTGDNAYSALVAVRVGPVRARFKGNLKMENVRPSTSYTINFEGQGGVAGFSKGCADVSLEEVSANETSLTYSARAQVGGKLAQVGSRLLDSAAGKITDDFFAAFEGKVRTTVEPEASDPSAIAVPYHLLEGEPVESKRPVFVRRWIAAAFIAFAIGAYFAMR